MNFVSRNSYDNSDAIGQLIRDNGEKCFKEEVVETMKGDASPPLYAGCSLTRLTATLRLFMLKAKNG